MLYKNNFSLSWNIFKIGTLIVCLFWGIAHATQNRGGSPDDWISVNGIEIYYKIIGSGKPTFVLHGGPGDSYETMLPLSGLADQYKLIFYDQRAAGRSTGDEDTASQAIDNFVEDLEQLRLKLAPGKINIIGGSWGAMLAMQYAMKYPDNVNALILMSSMGIKAEYFKDYLANIQKNRTIEDSLKLEQIAVTEEFNRREPETMEQFWRIYFRAYCYNPDYADSINLWLRDTTFKQVPGRYARLGEFLHSYDLSNDLKKITCPTLILYGDHDPTPLEWVKPIHDSIAGSQIVIFKNVGHWLWVEGKDKTISLIRKFLNKN